MPTVTFTRLATLGAGQARGAGSSYPPAFTASDSGLTVRRGLSSGSYYVSCGLLRYDTSGLPDGATIESAYLELYTFERVTANARKLVAEWYDAGETWDAADYTATAAATAHVGTALSAFPAGGYQNTTAAKTVLALTGLGSISTTGITGIRLHIDGGSPAGDNYLRIASSDGGGTNWNLNALLGGSGGVFTNPLAYITVTAPYYAPRLVVTYADSGQAPGNLPGSGESTDPASPIAQPRASVRLPRKQVPWRFLIGDSTGRPISWLTLAARNRTLSYRLGLPARAAFEVPSSDPNVATLHSDGLPMLEPQVRTLQAWRREQADDGTPIWRLRFSGWVWQIEDAGDADNAVTRVTAFDPLQVLLSRYTGSALAGDPATAFANVDGGSIVRQLVDWTNATVGPTGVTTSGGVVELTPARSVRYERKSIGQAITELASAFNGFDVWVEPVQSYDDFGVPVYDGNLCRLHCYARKGVLQEEMVYGWGIAPHNVREARRLIDGQTRATRVIGLGAGGITSTAETPAPLVLEALESYGDVSNQAFLDALVAEELGFRRKARELVTMVPQPGRSPEPFTHLNVGDLFKVYAGPRLRGGFQGVQRCYGFDLAISEEGIEQMTAIVCSPEGG